MDHSTIVEALFSIPVWKYGIAGAIGGVMLGWSRLGDWLMQGEFRGIVLFLFLAAAPSILLGAFTTAREAAIAMSILIVPSLTVVAVASFASILKYEYQMRQIRRRRRKYYECVSEALRARYQAEVEE